MYSCLVGGLHYLNTDQKWSLEDQAKLALFWAGFVVPTGILWSQLSRKALLGMGAYVESYFNIASWNMKGIGYDFVVN